MNTHRLAAALAVALPAACLCAPTPGRAATPQATADAASVQQEIAAMRAQIAALQNRLDALERRAAHAPTPSAGPAPQTAASSTAVAKATASGSTTAGTTAPAADTTSTHAGDTGITLGGAVRFQYSREGYNPGNRRRRGDMDFDIFRLDLHGRVRGIVLDAQWRWFQYMSAIQHAWVGYDFSDTSQLQLGLTRIPFGNQPFNSHSYFFSSNYYLGLEDTYAFGVEYVFAGDPWNVQLAFFKNDGTGGVDGAGNRTHSYSYDVVGVRAPGEGTFAPPAHPAGSVDTAAARVAYTFRLGPDFKWNLGASGTYGGLAGADARIGHHHAFALHTSVDYRRWNFQLQAARYAYHTRSHATELAVGAYAFYDTIPARADVYTANVAYHLPVAWGPIGSLDFYNDYSLVTHKAGNLPRTTFDVLGVGVSAGDLYTYIDFLTGRNQPFDGGSLAGDGKVEHRFNINFGFYF